MVQCFSSFVVSEVLVIVSSCAFIVMTLLTAIVSVTNVKFNEIDLGQPINDIHCQLPHKYAIPNDFDINRRINPNDYNSAYSAYLSLFESSLRHSLMSTNVIQKTSQINISEEYFIAALKRATSELSQTSTDINLLTSNWISNAFFKLPYLFSSIAPTGFTYVHNNTSPLFAQVKRTEYAFTIEDIKSLLFNQSLPLLFNLPSIQSDFSPSKELLADEVGEMQYFLLYGWNDDYIPQRFILDNNVPYQGGFIVRSSRKVVGHSLTYLVGNISKQLETRYCLNSKNPFQWPMVSFKDALFSNKSSLKCINKDCCDPSSQYYLIASPYDEEEPLVNNGQTFFYKNDELTTIDIAFPKLGTCFEQSIVETKNEQCDFWVIPYNYIEEVLMQSRFLYQSVSAQLLDIEWNSKFKFEDDTSIRQYESSTTERPKQSNH